MDLHRFLRSRRSVRRFLAGEIPTEIVERILVTAASAPSAHNRQPWRFAVLSESQSKRTLADALSAEYERDLLAEELPDDKIHALIEKSRARIVGAPLVVILCMDMSDMDVYPDARRAAAERTMAIQSTSNAGATLLLAAHAEGMGGVWSCAPLFAPDAVVSALALPATWEPQAMLLLGQPYEVPRTRSRRALREIAIFR